MKSSIHLFYGIIIGILLCACTGSNSDSDTAAKTDSATPRSIKEFEAERLFYLGENEHELITLNGELQELKKKGWTIIDVEVDGHRCYAHVGK